MKTRLMMIAGALLASLIGLPASAQSRPGMSGGMNAMGADMAQTGSPCTGAPCDCKQAPNPAACSAHREARAKAHEACKDSVGPQRKQCMHEQMQNVDCAKAGNPQQCESRKVAYKECQGQTGHTFRRCVQQKMPPVDCSKAPNQARCERHQQARAACKDKLGPEYKACLREQFGVK